MLKRRSRNTFSAMAVVVGLLICASPAAAQISLGTAQTFAVLAGSAVTNTGATVISGDLGVSPGTAVTGFPPGVVTPPGTIHIADAVAAQAQVDLTTAYNAIVATPTLVDLTGTDLGGLTLAPGVYGFSSSAQLTGTLTLDALGNPDAVFIFKIGTSLTTATGSSVLLINGGSNCKVFWQVGSSATLATTTAFAGNILALTSITLNTGAAVSGRALARNGAVTMAGNGVSVCPPAEICPVITLSPLTLPNGEIGILYSETITASGSSALPYTFTVSSGTLPTGLTLDPVTGEITGTPTTIGTFNFTITATDTDSCFGSQAYTVAIAAAGCPVITLSPITLPSGRIGTAYSQTVTASGGMEPYTFAVTNGSLPPGLSLDSATGEITGTPTTAGIFSFTITATDGLSCPGSLAYVISIGSCPVIELSPEVLPSTFVGVPYNETVSASGGTPPYTFAVTSGVLPTGLSLDSATGAITGTPTETGVFSFIITATDANGCTGSLGYTVTIVLSPLSIPTLSLWGLLALIALTGWASIHYLRRAG